MPWQQLKIEVSETAVANTEDCLVAAGAVSVSLEDAGDQPLLEPAPGETPLWQQITLAALFDENIDRDSINGALADIGIAGGEWQRLEDREWERVWLEDFAPQSFGRGLWICPHGQSPPEQAEKQHIVYLDPGLAFGTGHHATTALCLQWLAGATLHQRQVLDYGCGSGILALAAARLGASRVYAVDIDEQALIATRENALANELQHRLIISQPQEIAAEPVDIVLANILAGPLVSIAPELAAAIRAGGSVVLSGILDDQTDQVRQAYSPWFDFDRPQLQAGWARLNGIRNTRVHTMS